MDKLSEKRGRKTARLTAWAWRLMNKAGIPYPVIHEAMLRLYPTRAADLGRAMRRAERGLKAWAA